MRELTLDRDYARGSRGNRVKVIQEWLTLNGLPLVVDGRFGPATEFAVRQFQTERDLQCTGIVDENTFGVLTKPMTTALRDLPPRGEVGEMVLKCAKRHLRAKPREIGGQNMGPWVRLYMRGNQGPEWRWCAGFVSFMLETACRVLGVPRPITTSFSCDRLAESAMANERFLPGDGVNRSEIGPGFFFLQRRPSSDWRHVGIVEKATREVFLTIEGNTNDEGLNEGYEVCRRVRGYELKDFIRI